MNAVFFDIETAPLPDEQLALTKPKFEAASNLRDPEKIAIDIQRKEWRWLEEAALRAVSGRVLCIGLLREGASGNSTFDILDREDESDLLFDFWSMFRGGDFEGAPWVGFSIKHFDLPFVAQRSWALGVEVPPCVFSGRYLSPRFIDLQEIWQLFSRAQEAISLDRLVKFLGVGEKNGTGADFSKLWESDRAKALDYLRNDLLLTQKAAQKLGAHNFFPKPKDKAA